MDSNRFVALCVLLMVSIGSGCASPLVTAFENSQVFQPMEYPQGDWQPDDLIYEDAFFRAEDGTHLHGWFLPHPQPKAVVLFAHGNAGNLTHRKEMLAELRERHDVAVMIFDYRGYGRSRGKPSEQGILQDARAAREWLSKRTGVDETEIVLMGRSLGGGVAVDLAAQDGAAGLILINTFNSLVDVAEHHMSWLPTDRMMVNRLDSLSKIDRYQGPLLQTHGDADRVIPFEYGLELFGKANSPKQFIAVPGGDHNGPLSEEFHSAMAQFFDSLKISSGFASLEDSPTTR